MGVASNDAPTHVRPKYFFQSVDATYSFDLLTFVSVSVAGFFSCSDRSQENLKIWLKILATIVAYIKVHNFVAVYNIEPQLTERDVTVGDIDVTTATDDDAQARLTAWRCCCCCVSRRW